MTADGKVSLDVSFFAVDSHACGSPRTGQAADSRIGDTRRSSARG
jgi:hypothetical protein